MTLVLTGPLIRFGANGALRHETRGALAQYGRLPVGLPGLRDKRPEAIAVSIAAQLLADAAP